MPISTRPSTSVEKKVFKKKRSNMTGRLNRAARSINTGEAEGLTPGVQTELGNRRGNRLSAKKQQAITENRRRRH